MQYAHVDTARKGSWLPVSTFSMVRIDLVADSAPLANAA